MEQRVSHNLAWSDSLLIGNPKIDAEHKEIFELLGTLWGNDPLSRKETLEILISHVTEHFEGEESSPQFQALSPAEAELHRSEHQMLALFVMQAKSIVDLDEGEFAATIVDFIQAELIPHIRQRDQLLTEKC